MRQMKFLFRVDASLIIGTGHVMRCLTLAKALAANGAQCCFVCREHPGNLINKIRGSGFTVSVLPTDATARASDQQECIVDSNYASWLGVDWVTDAEQTKVGASGTAFDWLIVDHYGLDSRWEKALRPVCSKLMAIDDLASRMHDCDVLLDQNFGRDDGEYRNLVPDACVVLAGPQYALLRAEFASLRNHSLRRRESPQLRNLLITMGGVDKFNATCKVLLALQNCRLPPGLRINVVIGQHAPHLERVLFLTKQMVQPTELLVGVENMAELMAHSDFVIGAAGSTTWELFCLATPTLIVTVAENQANSAKYIREVGAAIVIDSSEISIKIPEILSDILKNNNFLHSLSRISRNITDGGGVDRVLKNLLLH